MGRYIINPRRAPRVPVRLRVRLEIAGAEFLAETRDLGPGGCLLVAPRVIAPGAALRLVIEADALPELLKVTGGAVWGAQGDRARVGIAFGPRQAHDPATWFWRFLEKNPAVAARLAQVPESLDDRTRLYLLEPPELRELRPEELAVLSGFADGITVGELLEDSREQARERARAIFGLLERRALTLSPGADRRLAGAGPLAAEGRPARLPASPPTLSRTSSPSPPSPILAPPVPGARSQAAELEFDVGRRLGALGNYSEALTHLRRALLLSPRDPAIATLIGEYAFKDRRVQ